MYKCSERRRRPHSKAAIDSTVNLDHNINWLRSSTYSTNDQLHQSIATTVTAINYIVPKVVHSFLLRPPAARSAS